MIRALLRALTEYLPPPRVIYDRAGNSPYLSRFYVFGAPRDDGEGPAFDKTGQETPRVRWRRLPVNLFLHRFHRGDDDTALHNHPWRWAVSLVLAGGYVEERRLQGRRGRADRVVRKTVRPWSLNLIRDNDYHRVDLLEHDCWSLFLAGPKAQSWGFWDRRSGRHTPWRQFIAELRGENWQAVS